MRATVVPVLLMLVAFMLNVGFAQTQAPVAGRDYIEIPNGSPLDPAEGKVVVEEYFNYICPACNSFEPNLAKWKAQLPPNVKLVYIPAAFRADFLQYARAFYAAQSFELVDETHTEVYDAIHRAGVLPSEGKKPDEERIAEFYARFGVDAQEFLEAMRSFHVDFKVRRGVDHMRRSKVSSTPSLVVNGRYLVRGSTFAEMLRIASFLIEKETQN